MTARAGVRHGMSPLELVQGAVVRSVVRRAGSEYRADPGQKFGRVPTIDYRVTVVLPDGGEVKFLASSATAWRRVVKKARLRLVSSVAKLEAAGLRMRIGEAVRAAKADPAGALLDSKIMARSEARRRKNLEKEAADRRVEQLETIRKLMTATRISKEEVLDLWEESVLADVMGS